MKILFATDMVRGAMNKKKEDKKDELKENVEKIGVNGINENLDALSPGIEILIAEDSHT